MTLSIIIPVYKVEKYLRKCLDSCLHQNISKEDYEIICVNDGSPDNSAQILDEYAAKHPNIRVVTQTNQGLSMARNNGLAVAQGDYVWFIDSDDWIEENCLAGICSALKSNPDLLQLNHQLTFEDNQKTVEVIVSFPNKNRVSGKYAIIYGGLPVPAQFSIYKRNYLDGNSLKFVSGIYHEDWEFKPRATYLANSIEWYKPVVYNYLQREVGSITSLFKLKNGFDHIFVMNNLHDFYHTVVKEDECKAGIKRQIGSLMNSVLLGFRSLNEQEKSELLKTLTQQKHLFKDMIESKNKKYAIEGFLLSCSPKLALRIHRIFR